MLATVVAAKSPREGVDFLPLTVDYQEKTYAAGRIPGGYFKREGRPTEKETLVSRLIDRPIRPLFVDGWRNETQVIVTVLSHDMENDPDIVALVASSAALTLSGAPFKGPIGAARVGFANDEFILNPTLDEMVDTQLDLVVAGTADAVLMVESEAKELNEDIMLGAVMFGHRHFQPVINAIIELAEKAAKEPREVTVIDNSALEKEMLGLVEQELRSAYAIPVKQDRYAAVGKVKEKVMAHYFPKGRSRNTTSSASPACSRSSKPRSFAGTSSTPASASTAVTARPCATSSPKSACCPAPTARRCSPAAKPRRWS